MEGCKRCNINGFEKTRQRIKSDGDFGPDVQKILDALPFYVLLVDKDHHVLLTNKAVQTQLKIHGECENVLGEYCPKVFHGLDEPFEHCPLEESVKLGGPVEKEYFDPESERWIRSAVYPTEFKTKEGNIAYFHTVQDITQQRQAEEQLKESLSKLNRITYAVIEAITTTMEKRDPYTAGHQNRVSKLAVEIARKMNLPEEQITGISMAALIHDIGKTTVPIEILTKPGRINVHEFEIIKNHVITGYQILKGIDFPWPVAKATLQHHERIDGSGYPNGLKGNDIILEARILSVADVVEAMSSHRPYRRALGLQAALEEITKGKGIVYDAEVVDACVEIFSEGFTLDVG